MTWVENDGGRKAAGFRGETGDCVARAIAIATQQPYRIVYDALNTLAGRSVARTGVPVKVFSSYLIQLGWVRTPTMRIGQGTRVHLRADELPAGRLVVQCSKHVVAVIDGIVHDTHDPTRGGTRCVYSYWSKP